MCARAAWYLHVLSGSSMPSQQQLQPSQSLKTGAPKFVVSFFGDCRETQTLLKEGPQSTPCKGACNTQIIEEQLKPPLPPTYELTLSKPQTFGKITFESQNLISNVHSVLDDKELLLRKSLVLL